MSERIRRLRGKFARVKPWAAVAILGAGALLAYYGILGLNYWKASGEVNELSSKVRQLAATVRKPVPDTDFLNDQIATRDTRRSQLEGFFAGEDSRSIVKLLADAAEETGVGLGSISIGDSLTRVLAGTELEARPASLVMSGDTERIYAFLSAVRRSTPATTVDAVRIARTANESSVSLQLLFYMAPWLTQGE